MGTTINIFLVSVISKDWSQSRRLPPSDLILLSAALLNIAIQTFASAEYLFRIVWREMYILEVFQKLLFELYSFIMFSSFWITAWLCVFYCLKIATFSHPIFLRLKMKISGSVPWLILGTLVAAFAVSVSVTWHLVELRPKNSTSLAPSMDGTLYSYSSFFVIFMCILGFSLPLSIIITSAVMILASLYRHTQRIQENSTSFSRPRMEAHKGAAKTILSLLLLYICFYIGTLVCFKVNCFVLRNYGLLLGFYEPRLIRKYFPVVDGIFGPSEKCG
ncbi:taste receptor type 2 member 41-like [Pleurodeles waltl]|uniref:taste receptor type 2 member 41-like n=1 Tax=Pleurodeles waltl TaxID=8319 RepID=UPI003709C39E